MTKAEALRSYLQGLPEPARAAARDALRLHLYRQDAEIWARRELGLTLEKWQRQMVSLPPGGRAVALCARQMGKTTCTAVAIAHQLVFGPAGSTSLILAPTARQSGEAVRRVRGFLLHAGGKLKVDNAFSLECENGSRVLGLPGSDDGAIRGLTVNGILLVDEAARVSDQLWQAALPMTIRHARTARVMVVSTAWAKIGWYYKLWSESDARDWARIEAKITECSYLTPEDIERERRSLPESVFNREYLGIFDSLESRFFNADSIAAAFGEVLGACPDVTSEGNDPDPVLARERAFSGRAFASGAF